MPPHDNDPHNYDPQQCYSAKRLSKYDMQVAGVVVYVVAMTVFFVIALVLMLFGTGTVTEAHAQATKAAQPLTNASATAEQRNKLAELTQPFPKPSLHPEDTNSDISELHAREDLLLDHYTWVDHERAIVRVPIDRAIDLIAQRGLPTAPAFQTEPLMTGDSKRGVAVPLTSGFARTENEQALTQTQR
jgi:hypothetical protein